MRPATYRQSLREKVRSLKSADVDKSDDNNQSSTSVDKHAVYGSDGGIGAGCMDLGGNDSKSNSAIATPSDNNDNDRVEFRVKASPTRIENSHYRSATVTHSFDEDDPNNPDDLLAARFEEFGTTPPRTRMKIKTRDWDRKQRANAVATTGSCIDGVPGVPKRGMTRMARSRVMRRNTMDCALLNEMFVNEGSNGSISSSNGIIGNGSGSSVGGVSGSSSGSGGANKRSDKRAQALLRESERDLKSSGHGHARVISYHESSHAIEALDKCTPLQTEAPLRCIPKVVESCNRYMSVSSRHVGCRSSAPPTAFAAQQILLADCKRTPAYNARKDFHDTFANLIKLGSMDRQDGKLSLEDHTWQTEVKDLIWLELQAWHADRTPDQQDKYLYTARQGVSDLLTQIINYKFHPRCMRPAGGGLELSGFGGLSFDRRDSSGRATMDACTGCMSLYCKDCMEQQEIALKEVEELLMRLEMAEALYPSSQAMGALHPIYKSESFVGRIKAMCLWYNITQQNKLKLCILGKILARLQGEKFSWPVQTSYTSPMEMLTPNSSSSAPENDDSGINSVDSSVTEISRKLSSTSGPSSNCTPKVHFMLNDVAHVPGETSSSNDSSEVPHYPESPSPVHYRKNSMQQINIFSVEPLGNTNGGNDANNEHSTALYRKFLENVLKSRGLAKSLSFLNKIHQVVLYKAHISLEKPGSEDYDFETEMMEEHVTRLEPEIGREQINELRHYGYWSPEAQSLNLPTYIPTFVFLSGMPLQFMHEYLRLRLETRPPKPNPLSLEQLMKELREGLTLALTHRERYQHHITTALVENESEFERYMSILNQFDATVRKVFELYLDYIDQLVLVATTENHQKSTLEKEWMFTKLISPMIVGMHTLSARKFCTIIRSLLRQISERLICRATELDVQIADSTGENEAELKWQVLTICREIQSLFAVEREQCVKIISFAKTFCRDVETADFHREHYDQDAAIDGKPENFVCQGISEAFQLLQLDVLDVRNKLTMIMERVHQRCSPVALADDQDRPAVLSRTREILHQGFKFGFEYNRDVIRLFEHRIMGSRCEAHQEDLALGIITFAKMWMKFVTERCERGRGMRPRWASQGLEFLILACDPQITRHLDERQFDELKKKMDCCISHVIGISSEPEKVVRKKTSPRSRKTSSPAASRSRTPTRPLMSTSVTMASPIPSTTGNHVPTSPHRIKFLHPQFSLRDEIDQHTAEDLTDNNNINKQLPSDSGGNMLKQLSASELRLVVPPTGKYSPSPSTDSGHGSASGSGFESPLALRQIRVRDAVNRLDLELEERMRERSLIGHVKELNTCDKIQIRARSVHFRWHRGIKIGQGRFGKVYTAVNNNTGELMAMKEIAIQPGDPRTLKNVADELKILEGIKHDNLVRYYGIEVHREELLIFMELCSEGTLESLVELSGGLPEGLTRRFSAQLLSGVAELHKHGIVHRDIKTANIFLVDSRNSLKLGDFGSAVKIQAHTTVPGELQGYVGTQAYMAPEVFTKTNSDGHGRAADIWSVGCVVVEMASGKRPWAQFDSNYQIMFKVGMGERPEAPETLSQEGHEFIDKCLRHDPELRSTAMELLQHNFCKYGGGDDVNAEQVLEQVRRSFRRNMRLN